jgi:hypothetical protein
VRSTPVGAESVPSEPPPGPPIMPFIQRFEGTTSFIVAFQPKQRELGVSGSDSDAPRRVVADRDIGQLALYLRYLAASADINVRVEGGGNAWLRNAGLDRATSVRNRLQELVGNQVQITWMPPSSRGTSDHSTILPGMEVTDKRSVIVTWQSLSSRG